MADWRSRIVEQGEADPRILIPHPENWRTHPAVQRASLERAIDTIGWVQAVTVNRVTGRIVDGHLRALAAIEHDEATVPVTWVELTEEEERLALLTLDPIAALANADTDLLAQLIAETGFDYEALLKGFESDYKLGRDRAGLTDPDEIPPVPDEPVARLGDIWLLGEHRVGCGDATKAGDVERLLGGAEPFLCVTDPPYGVAYDPAWRNVAAAEGKLAYAARRIGPVTNDDRADWSAAWALFPGDVIYSWHPAGATSLVHAAALQESGFILRMQIIWSKSNFPIGRGDYHVRHEPCWYAVRKGKAARRTGDRTQTTVWEVNLDRNVEGGHSTQKPVECMARPIRNHVAPTVYDPFVGSGTTLIAAEMLGRRCFAMEIEPRYVDVCISRWEAFTGGKAAKLDSGRRQSVTGAAPAKPRRRRSASPTGAEGPPQ